MSDSGGLIRAYYYTGNYQKCISECQKIFSWESDNPCNDAAFFLCLSLAAQGKQNFVISQLTQNNSLFPEIKQHMHVLNGDGPQSNDNLEIPEEWRCRWLAAVRQSDLNKSLEILHPLGKQQDCHLLRIQLLLQLDRVDLVKLEGIPSDSLEICSQIASAMYFAHTGEYQKAYNIYSELSNRYSSSCLLLNNRSVCLIGMNKLQEAEECCRNALELQGNDVDVLWNLINCTENGGVSTEEILSTDSEHFLARDLIQKKFELEELCKEMSVN